MSLTRLQMGCGERDDGMEQDGILEKLAEAEMVLVGLGEDFDDMRILQKSLAYTEGCGKLKEAGLQQLVPAWNGFCQERLDSNGIFPGIFPGTFLGAVEKLSELLRGKNHFVVSVSTDGRLARIGRVVMPCGSTLKKQCGGECKAAPTDVTDEDRQEMELFFSELYEGSASMDAEEIGRRGASLLGTCEACGMPLVLNTVYAEQYDEAGYLEQWKLYMKWLQGTLNRKLLVLELGVGMRFPSVIRWPFEKVAFFNKKAYFCRINETLYQLTRELSKKGCGISKNPIDWLEEL